jgi:hypothetical protein
MGEEDGFHAALDLIYGAVLDERLWPNALTKLADILATAHIGFCALDSHANAYHSIAPRTDPAWDAKYQQYWAFHNPLWKAYGSPAEKYTISIPSCRGRNLP